MKNDIYFGKSIGVLICLYPPIYQGCSLLRVIVQMRINYTKRVQVGSFYVIN